MSENQLFKLQHFNIQQDSEVFKIGTDALVLGSWIQLMKAPNKILDLGTGTGILSLMMAQKFPQAQITAIDSNAKAVELANFNFKTNPIGLNCNALHSKFELFDTAYKFDLIVSNPPYFINSMTAKSEVIKKSKHLNLNTLSQLFSTTKKLLKPDGVAIFIHPNEQIFTELALNHHLHIVHQLKVYGTESNLVRVCNTYSSTYRQPIIQELTIREKNGKYTEAYKQLTLDFHGVKL